MFKKENKAKFSKIFQFKKNELVYFCHIYIFSLIAL
jgi:hypothetical protein